MVAKLPDDSKITISRDTFDNGVEIRRLSSEETTELRKKIDKTLN